MLSINHFAPSHFFYKIIKPVRMVHTSFHLYPKILSSSEPLRETLWEMGILDVRVRHQFAWFGDPPWGLTTHISGCV